MSGTAPPKNAVIYLRVSTDKQVKKDYDPEGLSLPAQREACTTKAASLEARVVREYVEPGVSGGSLRKRKSFQQMLRDIGERGDIDYVIVWSVSRWARDQEDHWTSRGLIRKHGARLISVKEQIGGDSSSEIMVEGVLAAVAAGRRMEIAEDVKRGMTRKAQVGGTPYRAPLGYVNVSKVIDGREVRDIELDPDRAELIRECFRLYATGMFSLSDLAAMMEVRGLRSRPTKSAVAKPLTPNRLSSILRNTYYLGLVTVEGSSYRGRHEPLVDKETFEIIQELLKGRRQNGARAWKHQHYLAGTLFCAECGGRLLYSRNRSRNGTVHEYYVCINKQWGDCRQPYHRLAQLEARIDARYGAIELRRAERDRIRERVLARLEQMSGGASEDLRAVQDTLDKLKTHEAKLFEAFLEDSISKDLHDEQQQRIRRERIAAETAVRRLSADFDTGKTNLELALTLTGHIQQAYRAADEALKGLLNRSLFEAMYVDQHDEIVDYELNPPFGELVAAARPAPRGHTAVGSGICEQEAASARFRPCEGRMRRWAQNRPERQRNPRPSEKDGGSKVETMVPPGGIEPPLPA